jgi:hypothetical protein
MRYVPENKKILLISENSDNILVLDSEFKLLSKIEAARVQPMNTIKDSVNGIELCIFIHIYTNVFMYIQIHIHMYIYVYFVFVYIFVNIYKYIYIYICICVYIYICRYTYKYINIYIYICIYIYIYIFIHIIIHIHSYINLYIHPNSIGKIVKNNTATVAAAAASHARPGIQRSAIYDVVYLTG